LRPRPILQKAFQDSTAVVQSSGTGEVPIKCGESTEQYAISKAQYMCMLCSESLKSFL